MLQLLSRREDRALKSLLDCNIAPTDDQRAEINAVVQALKVKYREATGVEYPPTNPLRQSGLKYHDKILRYQRILSPVRIVPPEIWHRVFESAVLTIEPKTRQSLVLEDIRLELHALGISAGSLRLCFSIPLFEHLLEVVPLRKCIRIPPVRLLQPPLALGEALHEDLHDRGRGDERDFVGMG